MARVKLLKMALHRLIVSKLKSSLIVKTRLWAMSPQLLGWATLIELQSGKLTCDCSIGQISIFWLLLEAFANA